MKNNAVRAKVLGFVEANPNATRRECAAALGIPVANVLYHLRVLRLANLIPSQDPLLLTARGTLVLEYMSANPCATAKECAAATGVSFGVVRQQQFRLRTAGRIPLAPEGAREAAVRRWAITQHEARCAAVRAEINALADETLAGLLEPTARRRRRIRLRRLQQQLRHHESRRSALLEALVTEE